MTEAPPQVRNLRDAAAQVSHALTRLGEAMEGRRRAVRDALDAGMEPEEIAEAANLTVGQVWNTGRGDPISPPTPSGLDR